MVQVHYYLIFMYSITLSIFFVKKKDLIKTKKIFKFIKKKFKNNLKDVNFFLVDKKKKRLFY